MIKTKFQHAIALLICSFPLFFSMQALAATQRTLRHIQVEGAQHLSPSTVLSNLPIHVGQELTATKSTQIVKALYKTGFFKDVSLSRRGHTLIIQVKERATIGLLTIKGNKAIKDKKLKPVLKEIGIIVGNFYDPARLNEIKQVLVEEYRLMGYHTVRVKVEESVKPHNQVAIVIHVIEGEIAKVHSIEIKGSQKFSASKLKDLFSLTTSGILTWMTHTDRYSKAKLNADLQKLRFFYLDRGYMQYRLLSKKIEINPDTNRVGITIFVAEGPQYHLSGFHTEGKAAQDAEVCRRINLKVGDVFSRKELMAVYKSVASYYADKGYAFASVDAQPKIDSKNSMVSLTFRINKGRRYYVRDVHIQGNTTTKNTVILARTRQFERSLYSLGRVKRSERNLRNLSYLKGVHVDPVAVPGKPGQLDLIYHVTEQNAGRAGIQGGFGSEQGLVYGAHISEPSFLGSGKSVSLGFQKGRSYSDYRFSYYNPLYTWENVGFGYDLFYTQSKPEKINLDAYRMDNFGGSLRWSYPISEDDSVYWGLGYTNIKIGRLSATKTSPALIDFTNKYGRHYHQMKVLSGWTRYTTDRAYFPTSGSHQEFGVTVGVPWDASKSFGYYSLHYHAVDYFPLYKSFILRPHAFIGYGNGFGSTDRLPFFEKFYGGGMDTLIGFDYNTLGPKNPRDTSASLGGNLAMFAGADLILPNFISDKVRTALTIGAGNVFETHHLNTSPSIDYQKLRLDNIRASVGLTVEWFWPLGPPIKFGIGVPIRQRPGDHKRFFSYSFSGGF